jgi:hypothetical protein
MTAEQQEDTTGFRPPLIRYRAVAETEPFPPDNWSSESCFVLKYSGSTSNVSTHFLNCAQIVGIWLQADDEPYFDDLASLFLVADSEPHAFVKSYELRRDITALIECGLFATNDAPSGRINAQRHFDELAERTSSADLVMDPDLLAMADLAVARLDARKDEDIDEWAQKLAEDLSKFKD